MLAPGEADEVLGLLKAEAKQVKLSILLITHKFREVQAFADEVTILRKGQRAGKGSGSFKSGPGRDDARSGPPASNRG